MAGAVAVTPLFGATALAEPVISIGMRAGVDYSKNPFLLTTRNVDALRGTVSLSPSIENQTPRSLWRLSGDVSYSDYSRLYQSAADYRASLAYRNTLTRRLTFNAQGGYSSSVNRNFQNGAFNPVPVEVTPGEVPLPTLPDVTDITLAGLQDRQTTFSGNAGLSYVADARNSVSLSYFGAVTKLPDNFVLGGPRANRFSSYGQTFGYNRVINSRLTAGASVAVSRFEFSGTPFGNSVSISPTATATLRLSGSWSISGGVGVVILRQETIFGRQNTTSLSGNLRACRVATRESTCLTASRGVAPSSLGTARVDTGLGATYSYRLSPRDDLSFSGGYQRSGETVPTGFGNATSVTGSARYTRQLNQRLGLFVDTGFSRISILGTRSDARVGAGISYNWRNRP